jgi:hypothetical protein
VSYLHVVYPETTCSVMLSARPSSVKNVRPSGANSVTQDLANVDVARLTTG